MKFPKLVIDEATALIKNATKRERAKLDFYNLDPQNWKRCIYGQMTGDCFSQRALDLIHACASKVYSIDRTVESMKVHEGCELNGSPKNAKRIDYFSPIEVFISKHPNKEGAGKLIQFIKGEIKTL